MKATPMTFQRMEKKYLLTQEQREQLYYRVQPYLTMDPYGPSTICNLYFDTEDDRLITASLQKPVYKEKLRLRSYGIPDDNTIVYLEIKKKCKGVVNKRRIDLTLAQARAYLERRAPLPQNSQIAAEIDYFMAFYHPLPKVYLAYDRVALIGKEQSDLRLTFDTGIRRRYDHLDLGAGTQGTLLFTADMTLLEIKVKAAYPLWLTRLLTEMKLYPISFSKYGTVYQQDFEDRVFPSPVSDVYEKQIMDHYQKGESICLPVY